MTDAVPAGLTVLEAIERLRSDGYDADFSHGDGLRCERCGRSHRVDGVDIEAALRVEGASDPADEAIVLGLRCTDCESRGGLWQVDVASHSARQHKTRDGPPSRSQTREKSKASTRLAQTFETREPA